MLCARSRGTARGHCPLHSADCLRGAGRQRQRYRSGGMSQTIDAARLTLLLNDLRLPAIKQGWAAFAERADKEGWPAARFRSSLAECGVANRARPRSELHLIEARLLPGKTLDAFEFEAVPMVSKAHV